MSIEPGTLIGPYKVLEQLGEGSAAVVFAAEQVEPVRRKVAIKIPKLATDERLVVARFEAERQALAIIDHSNVVKIYDGGWFVAPGRPYFVMELVQGLPITEFCDRRRLPLAERLHLIVQLCRAVQHAHQKGIIHRGLKPSDVLVTTNDAAPVVKLIDFGIAKAVGWKLTDKTLFIGVPQMIGPPPYMSPEQAGMSGLDVDTRSDIYSLGALLYELLTGTTPLDHERLRAGDENDVRRIIQNEQPPKPSTRLARARDLPDLAASRGTAPSALVALVQGQLDAIVMKCLEKKRDLRYDSAGALADELEQVIVRQATGRWQKFFGASQG
jgi:serine/threonine-protein kinase